MSGDREERPVQTDETEGEIPQLPFKIEDITNRRQLKLARGVGDGPAVSDRHMEPMRVPLSSLAEAFAAVKSSGHRQSRC